MNEEKPTGLALLRVPFPAHQISKLPKPTKAQTDEVKVDFKKGIRCEVCGSWHHPKVVHLDYVGHAALTDRLLDADQQWNWEPFAVDERGLPALDGFGGMWIRLTICGVTRIGYGHAGDKEGGDAVKEIIGDALRNGSMRFGAALELWHKGVLHKDDTDSLVPVLEASIAAVEREKTGARAAAAEEAGRRLDGPTKTGLIKLAREVIELFKRKDEGAGLAFDRIEIEGLDSDAKAYLWGQLDDSKLRSALQRESQIRALKHIQPEQPPIYNSEHA